MENILEICICSGVIVGFGLCRYLKLFVEVTEDQVISGWLKSEATDNNHQYAGHYKKLFEDNNATLELVTNPKFNDEDNKTRKNIFWPVRGNWLLWNPIHEYTTWYKTKIIFNWDKRTIIAPFAKDVKTDTNYDLNGIILWGHSIDGPFIILDGNHRYNGRNKSWPIIAEVYIGISDCVYSLCADNGCEYCGDDTDDIPYSAYKK